MSKSIAARAKDAFLWKAGPALSKVGERTGVDWLTYNPLLYFQFHELAKRNAPGVVGTIAAHFPSASTWLDVGAGTGAFAAHAKSLGKQVRACEYSPTGRAYARKQGVDSRPFDLTQEPPTDIAGTFDLAYCFEIAEHLTPEVGERLVAFLVGKARTIVFTAAQPGQGGSGHINEQPRAYWIERFTAHDEVSYDPDATARLSAAFAEAGVSDWFENNVSVFTR